LLKSFIYSLSTVNEKVSNFLKKKFPDIFGCLQKNSSFDTIFSVLQNGMTRKNNFDKSLLYHMF
jgi:hypothetical protein